MHEDEAVAWVKPDTPLRQVIIAMSQRPLGAACVVDESFHLLGIITDGDLRRALLTHEDIRLLCAADCMTRQPITINPEASLRDATRLDGRSPLADLRPPGGGLAQPTLSGLNSDS